MERDGKCLSCSPELILEGIKNIHTEFRRKCNNKKISIFANNATQGNISTSNNRYYLYHKILHNWKT
jgi:hypothetical protein